MRILITGGHGFIGGRLAQHLLSAGNYVILGSRNLHQQTDWLPGADNVLVDWSSQASLIDACKSIDLIIHTAGMNAADCEADPIGAFKANAISTGNLVEAAKLSDVKRLIYLSSAHVYASPLKGDIDEDVIPKNLHPYAMSHLARENFILNSVGIEGMVLRISNAFGAPVCKEVNCWMLLVNDLCKQIIETGQIILHSNGQQIRDFITMHDLTAAISHLAALPIIDNTNKIMNIGGELSLSVYEMAKIIAERNRLLFGYLPKIERPLSTSLDNSVQKLNYKVYKLRQTGFKLTKNIEQEIDETLLFCSKNFTKILYE
jgi:UDP-glucose 4-epimerase